MVGVRIPLNLQIESDSGEYVQANKTAASKIMGQILFNGLESITDRLFINQKC